MRVLVDATMIKGVQGGIRSYTRGLISALESQSTIDLAVLGARQSGLPFSGRTQVVAPRTSSRVLQSALLRAAWREARLGSVIPTAHPDVLVVPSHELPLGKRLPVPTAIVVHDVGPLIAPRWYGRRYRARYAVALNRICERASAIVCVTYTTLISLANSLAVDVDKLTVIGPALSPPSDHPAQPLRQAAPEGRQFLYVGALFPHKNLRTLITAFAHSRGSLGSLTICGPDHGDPGGRALANAIQRAGAADVVHYRGFVSDATLELLFNGATALVLPSAFEGFGIPVVEAQLRGLPVVASDIPAIREVVDGDATLVKNPWNSAEWQAALAATAVNSSGRPRSADPALTARLSPTTVGRQWLTLLQRLTQAA